MPPMWCSPSFAWLFSLCLGAQLVVTSLGHTCVQLAGQRWLLASATYNMRSQLNAANATIDLCSTHNLMVHLRAAIMGHIVQDGDDLSALVRSTVQAAVQASGVITHVSGLPDQDTDAAVFVDDPPADVMEPAGGKVSSPAYLDRSDHVATSSSADKPGPDHDQAAAASKQTTGATSANLAQPGAAATNLDISGQPQTSIRLHKAHIKVRSASWPRSFPSPALLHQHDVTTHYRTSFPVLDSTFPWNDFQRPSATPRRPAGPGEGPCCGTAGD